MNKELDESIILGYLGPAGTFTKQAAVKRRDKYAIGHERSSITLKGAGSISEVLKMVRTNEVTHGVIPIETTVSDVKGAIETLASGDFAIVGEDVIRVEFGIYTWGQIPDKDIKCIYSKPEVYPQCSIYLNNPLREKWERTEGLEQNYSTAAALEYLVKTKDPTIAAIASPAAALDLLDEGIITEEEYRNLVCKPNIGNSHNQFTRFATIVNSQGYSYPEAASGFDATTFILEVEDVPGGLYECLNDIPANITKIRSFHRTGGLVSFFMTTDGHIDQPEVSRALSSLSKHSRVKILGSYPRDSYPNTEYDYDPEIKDVMDDIQRMLREDGFSNHSERAIAFTVKNEPRALAKLTKKFYEYGVNLTRIDSLHSRRRLGEYIFYLTYKTLPSLKQEVLMEHVRHNCIQLKEITI